MAAALSVRDVQLPDHIQNILIRLKAAGFATADVDYEVPNKDLPRHGFTLADLRQVLRTGVAQVGDGAGNVIREATGIVTSVGQDDHTTVFRLIVNLVD